MEFMEFMLKRESCREFQNKPVSRDDIVKIIEAGRLTPSGCNAQPWKFIVADESEALEGVREALVVSTGKTGCAWRADVPVFIILAEQPANLMPAAVEYYKDTQRFAQGDIGAAAMNMCYEAEELGLSTCILGLIEQKTLQNALGIPRDREVRLILAVGYAKEDKEPRKKIRKDFNEVCSFNKW